MRNREPSSWHPSGEGGREGRGREGGREGGREWKVIQSIVECFCMDCNCMGVVNWMYNKRGRKL